MVPLGRQKKSVVIDSRVRDSASLTQREIQDGGGWGATMMKVDEKQDGGGSKVAADPR